MRKGSELYNSLTYEGAARRFDLEKVARAGLEAIKGEPFARIVASESLDRFAKTGVGEDAGHARWIVEDPARRAQHIYGSWRDYQARAEAMIDAILKDRP